MFRSVYLLMIFLRSVRIFNNSLKFGVVRLQRGVGCDLAHISSKVPPPARSLGTTSVCEGASDETTTVCSRLEMADHDPARHTAPRSIHRGRDGGGPDRGASGRGVGVGGHRAARVGGGPHVLPRPP